MTWFGSGWLTPIGVSEYFIAGAHSSNGKVLYQTCLLYTSLATSTTFGVVATLVVTIAIYGLRYWL